MFMRTDKDVFFQISSWVSRFELSEAMFLQVSEMLKNSMHCLYKMWGPGLSVWSQFGGTFPYQNHVMRNLKNKEVQPFIHPSLSRCNLIAFLHFYCNLYIFGKPSRKSQDWVLVKQDYRLMLQSAISTFLLQTTYFNDRSVMTQLLTPRPPSPL